MKQDGKPFNRVLIIDDDPASGYLARIAFEDTNAAEDIVVVQVAEKGLEFIKSTWMNDHAAKEECPDLILLDVNMPGMDGFEFLDELQKLGKDNIIRTVTVLSSSTSPRDKAKIDSYGIQAFIIKPITEEQIMALSSKGC